MNTRSKTSSLSAATIWGVHDQPESAFTIAGIRRPHAPYIAFAYALYQRTQSGTVSFSMFLAGFRCSIYVPYEANSLSLILIFYL